MAKVLPQPEADEALRMERERGVLEMLDIALFNINSLLHDRVLELSAELVTAEGVELPDGYWYQLRERTLEMDKLVAQACDIRNTVGVLWFLGRQRDGDGKGAVADGRRVKERERRSRSRSRSLAGGWPASPSQP